MASSFSTFPPRCSAMGKPLSEEEALLHVVYHVFLPPKLPQEAPNEGQERQINHRLVLSTLDAVEKYRELVPENSANWGRMFTMLSKLAQNIVHPLEKRTLAQDMMNMEAGDVLSLYIRAQNSVVIIRKSSEATTFEVFEAQAPDASVMSVPGKLVRHFPGPVIQIPSSTVNDPGFIEEISNFLARMNVDVLEGPQGDAELAEGREVGDPHYISQLFTGILRGFGKEVEPRRVLKRIADEVLWDRAGLPWRRSPIWLIIRVAIQTSVDSADYKHFMVHLHTHLLALSSQVPSFSSDLLATMRAKMARRMFKAQDSLPDVVIQVAKAASDQTEAVLQDRWATIQKNVPHFGPLKLDLERAVVQTLPNSRDYLQKVLQGRSTRDKPKAFNPNHGARLVGQDDFSVFAKGALTRSFNEHKHFALFDFENAVYNYLPSWVDNRIQESSTTSCATVSSCIEQYKTAALSFYSQDMTDRSIMMLTIMELWMALDRLATSQHNLLLQYSPEIPGDIIEPLLLRSSLHLERAGVIQAHIQSRHINASLGSVFTDEPDQDSLPVRFFEQSPSLQALKRTIEEDAERKRNDKIEELNSLNKEHAQLLSTVSQISCEYDEDHWGTKRHRRRCNRCSMLQQAKTMQIEVHEWPLPADLLEAQAAVFELQCSEEINLWRAATYEILCDLGDSARDGRANSHCLLAGYDGLGSWANSKRHRITIASSTKSFRRLNYSETKIPATQSMVCVDNGLDFRLFDSSKHTWAAGPFTKASFSKYGTFTLPAESSYSYLQFALEGTAHTSNQILADQSDCPKDISLHEHYAFGTLRSGPRLQWMNIVRGLEENILTFSREEVNMLHTQAAWQIGPLSQDEQTRDWHTELHDARFGQLLVRQAFRVLDRVRANWLEGTTVHTIVMLVARLLSSTTDTIVHTEAYRFLRDARAVTFGWVDELSAKCRNAELESQILDYQLRISEMAAICRSTYDVEEPHLRKLLSSTEDHLAFVYCSMALHDNQPPKIDQAPQHLRALICRDRRLAFQALPISLDNLQHNPNLLDESISRYWNGYRPGASGWTALPNSNSRWVITRTASDSTISSQQVHINLLEGTMLVNGQPLGRLPRDYVVHPIYTRLFGKKLLDVVPTNSGGMAFETRGYIEGNRVSFYLDPTTGDLVIQTARDDATFELIPCSKLTNDLPLLFSIEYHHWINLSNGDVEFRPLANPWTSNKNNWHLRSSATSTGLMEKTDEVGSISLFDVYSPAFRDVSRQIAPLESSCYLHITRSNSKVTEISAELPRMKLAFFINNNMQLESRNLPGQVVDKTQSSGTLFGLRDQLVLCAKDRIAKTLPRSRTVLIPYGTIGLALQKSHTEVTIDRGSKRHVTFYQYKIDVDLGYLANINTNLTSRLFKIYLHALTSHCLPDPLTDRTGTEEALYELSESATTSFDQIDKEQAQLLKLIGALTPQREYYPAHLQVMQTTKWNTLPPLAQHYAFCTVANSILQRASSLQLFNPSNLDLKPYMTKHDEVLLCRAAHRSRMCYPIDTTFQIPTALEDHASASNSTWYEPQDHTSSGWTQDGQLTSWVSSLLCKRWGKPTYIAFDLVPQFEKWGVVHGPSSDLELTYSRDWLKLQLPLSWLSMYNLCRQAGVSNNQYALGICLSSGVYSGSLPPNLVPILVSLAVTSSFQSLAPPTHRMYQLSDKYKPAAYRISQLINCFSLAIEKTPSNNLPKMFSESTPDWSRRRTNDFNLNVSTHEARLTQFWMDCWPDSPLDPPSVYSIWFDVSGCLEQTQLYFESCSRNADLQNHLRCVERALSSAPATLGLSYSTMSAALPKPLSQKPFNRLLNSLTVGKLMEHRICPTVVDVPHRPNIPVSSTQADSPNTDRLEKFLSEFHESSLRPLHRLYGSDLETSRVDLSCSRSHVPPERLPEYAILEQNMVLYEDLLRQNLAVIKAWLGPVTNLDSVVFASGIWPRLTPRNILARLALRARKNIATEHLSKLQTYARSHIEYQRSQRLISLARDEKHDEFFKELNFANASAGGETDHPDWLLIQIDGNFSARTVQTQVAQEMIAPSSAMNTVLQLNMGEGKSSVIVPIISAALADGTRLVRVVVLKPLWRQMFHLLVSRLSGLVGRRIYYLPFGRHIRVGQSESKQIRGMYAECMRDGGILLVQPEHILSLRLMGIDQILSSSTLEETAASKSLQDMQDWLSQHARDILDESDEILHVRYQLVYTVGQQQPLEGHPDRWTTTQQILLLVAAHINRLKSTCPDKLKYETRGDGQFPFIRIMPESDEVVSELVKSIAQDSLAGVVPNLNFGLLPRATRKVALHFLINRNVSPSETQILQSLSTSLRDGLLLLRGLLACGIIAFALRDKHYRIDYGLHLSRSLLAVPYHAKDIPSPRAEFGHPDVAIVLTCLSYYNNGLTDSQLHTCFELLYKLDNPTLEYEQWVRRNHETPAKLRQLSGVNLKDHEQFSKELIKTFGRNSAVVDFFLTSVVFPKAAKQFPYKLSTSGWDLAEVKTHVTTGFSGTNDNRYLLPTSITQSDPVKQSSTNALVLTYLLQPENNHYLCIRGADDETCSAKEFLHTLVKQDPEIRVLLDVGAQMLELTNDELVKYWLELWPDVAAAVYFNDEDELVILPQNGSPTPFHASPFAQQMERCIVYLDDGHTRGTDLKLPKGTRAAVTLGPKVTKDRLLQGCMRMRKLGFGQSVMFCAPVEIDTQIRKAGSLTRGDRIDALDVIRWTMHETCKDLERYISHWAQQGVEYHRRLNAQQKSNVETTTEALKRGWMIPESRTLQEMYDVSANPPEPFTRTALGMPSLKERLVILGSRELEDPRMDEEQEREVSHEVERERQIERPPKAQPAPHSVHPDVIQFAQTGSLPSSTLSSVISLFHPLTASKTSQHGPWCSLLLASLDFCNTIRTTNTTQLNEYMRPINWILSGSNGILLALSPYEANQLLPEIRKSRVVWLHVFSPRTILAMLSFTNLQFYSTPSPEDSSPSRPPELLYQLQLSLFAGQLYFDDYAQYRILCGFLGLFIGGEGNQEAENIQVQSDGFIPELGRQTLSVYAKEYLECQFMNSPIGEVKCLLGYRRKGTEYLRTHVGQMLHARQLTQNDF